MMTIRRSRSVAAAVALGCLAEALADVGPIPPATLIPGTTFCVVDGWEYAPRWSTPNNGYVSPSLEQCAADCEADPVCTGATFIVKGSKNNCWFKDWGVGPAAPPCLPPDNPEKVFQAIIDPAGATCETIMYMASTVYPCEIESTLEKETAPGPEAAMGPDSATLPEPALAPDGAPPTVTDLEDLAALAPPYTGYAGVDYSPGQVPPPAVQIADVGAGMIVANAVECATACSDDPACNAASYYGDNPQPTWPGGSNCYLKTLTGCALPADAEQKVDSTIFMIGGTTCANAPLAAVPAATPLGVLPPLAAAPLAATPLADPLAPSPLPGTLAPPLGFAPVPGGVPPLVTDDVSTDVTDVTGAGTNETTRAFDAAPTQSESESADTSTSAVQAADPSSGMRALPGCFAAASALAAAMLL